MPRKIQGTVVLSKRQSFWGQNVSFTLHLISAVHPTSLEDSRGQMGKGVDVEDTISMVESWTAAEASLKVEMEWDDEVGIPEAFLIINKHRKHFFLVSLTLEGFPNQSSNIHFPCNSWVFPTYKYTNHRIFFANKTYVPSETPKGLVKYREEELLNLRGDGTGELQKWDRVYDYATYNDLGNSQEGQHRARPVLGGSHTYPYPRRARTGRPPTPSDPGSETRVKSWDSIYVPRDERFAEVKKKDFDMYKAKSAINVVKPKLKYLCNSEEAEFNSFNDVLKLYKGGLKYPKGLKSISNHMPTIMKQFFQIESEDVLRFPMPQVIAADETKWMSDEEFAREMLAGVNPVKICCLQEFPPKSKLDKSIYGDHSSKITKQQIERNLDGLTVKQALANRKLFVLDYHDDFMPYLRQINNNTCAKGYATRTILFLKNDGTLKPLAIELSLPHSLGDQFGASSEVYLPADHGVLSSIWRLAKAYVLVNDSGYHQLISHWLHTHAVIEPFIIATHRQLSVLHPIYKLLHRHFRDTMKINSLARKSLISEGGTIESTFFTGKYSMELSSMMYKNWVFPEQALPVDLVNRGMAIEDPTSPIGIRLVIEDYPFAVDGLEIWFAIKKWVEDYCSIYYKKDDAVQEDYELQKWWKEVVEVGHGDKRQEPWWPKMQTRKELIESCTIIIWIASALHAAVNFGQYAYAGFVLNRPTLSRKYMPEEGTLDYDELERNPEKAFLRTITSKKQTLEALLVIQVLSEHSYDELYIGQTDNPSWTCDEECLYAFENFGKSLKKIEENIRRRNSDERLKNRYGPVEMHYTSLSPYSEVGLTGKGIPNSISM